MPEHSDPQLELGLDSERVDSIERNTRDRKGVDSESSSIPTLHPAPVPASNRGSAIGICLFLIIVLVVMASRPFPIIWRTTGVDTGDGWILYLDEVGDIQSVRYELNQNQILRPENRLLKISVPTSFALTGLGSREDVLALEAEIAREQEALNATLKQVEVDEARELDEILSVEPRALVFWLIRRISG